MARRLFELARSAQERGWSAEDLLKREANRRERQFRKLEKKLAKSQAPQRVPAT
jgi:hypothetical protein